MLASGAQGLAESTLNAAGADAAGLEGAGSDGSGSGNSNNPSGSSGGGGSGGSPSGGGSGRSATAATSLTEETEEPESISAVAGVRSVPGLYGNQYELQVDVSRLPRIDQYQQMISATGLMTDRPSDMKSVAYYVVGGMVSSTPATGTSAAAGAGGAVGLVRRELDRAATAWANAEGNFQMLDQYPELLAPEVVGLEFMYYDGTEWVLDWDSDLRGGLPLAVEIALYLSSPDLAATTDVLSTGEYRVYRLTVHLPAGIPTTLDTAATGEPLSGESTSSSMEALP
jgi:hypothetical protein